MISKLYKYICFLTIIFLYSCFNGETETRRISSGHAPFDPNNTPIKWTGSSISSGLNVNVSTDFTDNFVAGDLDGSGHNPIQQMMKNWNSSTSHYNFFNITSSTTSNKDYSSLSSFKNDGEFGIYKSTSWFSNVSASALAITQYFGYRRNPGTASEYVELYHADIIVNYRDHFFSLDSSDSSSYDLPTVILHELGHFIGLSHESNYSTQAVMLPYLGKSESKRTLTSQDTSNIRSLYNVSALSSRFSAIKSRDKITNDKLNDEEIRGVIELRSDGECYHFINDKFVHKH